jgi:hypothetical protein
MRPFAFVGFFAGLFVVLAAGQDAVTFKVAYPKKGDKLKVTVDQKVVTRVTVSAKGKDEVKNETEVETHLEYTDDVEEGTGAAPPARLSRRYTKATMTVKGTKEKHPLDGKTVVIEKRGDKYEFTPDGFEKLDNESKELLDEEFNKSARHDLRKFMMPPKALKAGEKWKIEGATLAGALVGQDFKLGTKFDATGEVQEAEKTEKKGKKGSERQSARVKVEFEAPVIGLADKKVKVNDGSKLTVGIIAKGSTDAAAPQETTTTIVLDVVGTSEQCDVKVYVNTSERRTVESAKK